MVQLYMYLLSVVAFHEKVITFFILLLQQFSYISYFCVQVGPADMFDIHQQLIELRKQEKELEVRSSVLLLLRWKLTKNFKVIFCIMQTLKPKYV